MVGFLSRCRHIIVCLVGFCSSVALWVFWCGRFGYFGSWCFWLAPCLPGSMDLVWCFANMPLVHLIFVFPFDRLINFFAKQKKQLTGRQ